MLEPSGIEVTAEFPVDDVQDVAIELGGHATRVVVRRLEPCRILDEVGAEQQRLARPEQPVEIGEERRALRAREVADRRAEEREQPPPSFRQPHEVVLEVADDAVHLDPGILLGDPGRGLPQRLLGDVEGHEALQVARLDHRVEQEPGLLGRSRAGLDERVRGGQPRDVARVLGEDDALSPGEVVLGQLRDLLEEHRAALVVEPLRRQLLRRRREALARRLRARRPGGPPE